MNARELLASTPSTSDIEAHLMRNGESIVPGGEMGAMLDQYREARAALTRVAIQSSVQATGFIMVEAKGEMSPDEAVKLTKECAAYFREALKL